MPTPRGESQPEKGVRWSWSSALRGAVLALPSATVAVHDLELAASLAVGLLPLAPLPLPPTRTGRLGLALYGLLAAVSIMLGGLVAQWPVVAVLALLGLAVAMSYAVAILQRPQMLLGLFLCLPLMAVGFSYPGLEQVGGLAVLIALGTGWAVLISLLWPTWTPGESGQRPVLPPRHVLIRHGWLVGVAGATCAAIGFLLDLEHVGWAPTAALLVMRPNPHLQHLRSIDRLADVAIGATAAIVLVTSQPPPAVFAIAIAGAVTAATATSGSRWYVLPTFSTFFVFLLLLADDLAAANARLVERVAETGLGIGTAAALGVVAAVIARATSGPLDAPSSGSGPGRRT